MSNKYGTVPAKPGSIFLTLECRREDGSLAVSSVLVEADTLGVLPPEFTVHARMAEAYRKLAGYVPRETVPRFAKPLTDSERLDLLVLVTSALEQVEAIAQAAPVYRPDNHKRDHKARADYYRPYTLKDAKPHARFAAAKLRKAWDVIDPPTAPFGGIPITAAWVDEAASVDPKAWAKLKAKP